MWLRVCAKALSKRDQVNDVAFPPSLGGCWSEREKRNREHLRQVQRPAVYRRAHGLHQIAGDVGGEDVAERKKPMRSTIPAIALSRGGSRSSGRNGFIASSGARTKVRSGSELPASVGIFGRSYDFACVHRSLR
jgi:hypothetical protein